MLYMLRNHINVIWALVVWHTQSMCKKSGGGLFWLSSSLRLVLILVLTRGFLLGTFTPRRMVHVCIGGIMYSMFSRIVAECRSISTFQSGIFLVSRIKAVDVFLSRAIVNFYLHGVATVLFTVFAISYYGGMIVDFYDWQYAFFGWLLIAFFGLGFGMFANATTLYYPFMRRVYSVLLAPMLFLSGLFFEMSKAQPIMQNIAEWNPISIGVHLVRYGVGIHSQERFMDYTYMIFLGATFMAVGLLVGRKVWRIK